VKDWYEGDYLDELKEEEKAAIAEDEPIDPEDVEEED
jgi:hypothetical protein